MLHVSTSLLAFKRLTKDPCGQIISASSPVAYLSVPSPHAHQGKELWGFICKEAAEGSGKGRDSLIQGQKAKQDPLCTSQFLAGIFLLHEELPFSFLIMWFCSQQVFLALFILKCLYFTFILIKFSLVILSWQSLKILYVIF